MHALAVFRVLGILLTVFSVTMLIPLFVGFFYQDVLSEAFLIAFAITLGTGLLCWLPMHKQRSELSIRDGFLVTVLFWAVLSFYGAIPLYLEVQPELSAVDSIFESISGLTTTGATVIQGLDELPKSVLFYRQQLQWLGGMGIVLLALAVLPMLGIGGMLSLTVVCALAYWLAGMEPFDAIAHSFSTVSIGGFSTHDSSIGFFANPAIELIAVVFIVISGINFGLHFSAFRHRSLRSYWSDLECKTFLLILTLMTLISSIVLIVQDEYDLVTGLRYGLFATVSIATTTGFTSADYSIWPSLLPFLLFLCSFAGGCAGSTGGGSQNIAATAHYETGQSRDYPIDPP